MDGSDEAGDGVAAAPRRRRRFVVAVAAVLAALAASGGAAAQSGEEPGAAELAARYAPVVVTRDQEGPCDRGGEAYRPTGVEVVLDKPEIVLRDGDGEIVARGPGAEDLAGLGPETSLDFPGDPRRAGCDFEEDFIAFSAGEPDVAYAHIAREATAPDRLVLQYWLFWYFDDYVNTHEGDWEFIQIVFPATTAQEALQVTPLEVGYSQHSGGERAAWDDDKLERRGDHPVVYAGAGSHANFFTSDLYLGRSADEGFGCDDTTGPSTYRDTEARLLPATGAEGRGDLAWLSFEGRWGEFQPSPYDAPPGPAAKGEWVTPIEWQNSLRDSSFAIPASRTLGPTATDAFCSVVRTGGRIYTAVTSPFVLLLLVGGLVSVGGFAARSTKWSPPLPLPLRRRRESGQILRDSARLWRAHRPPMLALGALFIPAAIVESVIYEVLLGLTPVRALIDTASEDSLVSAALALIVGGAGHIIAAAVVMAGAAAAVARLDAGGRIGGGDGLRGAGAHVWAVLGVLGLVMAAVVLLVLTVVGIPVAVYLIGRWAVANQVAVLEGLPARDALRRSAELTRGRWWRTVRLAAVVNILGAVSGPAIGIALLFTTDMPLAAINGVSSLVFIIAMPFVGLAMAYLYGDLAAAEAGAGASASTAHGRSG